jgi:hypothetical protein
MSHLGLRRKQRSARRSLGSLRVLAKDLILCREPLIDI